MTNPPQVGKLIGKEENVFRDAIHVAVCPVVANCTLGPGQRVGIVKRTEQGDYVVGYSRDIIGIVDPFLSINVFEGERCWLFMLPNSVSNLRHAWQHEAFSAKVPIRNET